MTSLRHREIDERPLSDAVGPVIDTDLITIERTELDESWSIAHVHAERLVDGPATDRVHSTWEDAHTDAFSVLSGAFAAR
jgi:hypothetical protein